MALLSNVKSSFNRNGFPSGSASKTSKLRITVEGDSKEESKNSSSNGPKYSELQAQRLKNNIKECLDNQGYLNHTITKNKDNALSVVIDGFPRVFKINMKSTYIQEMLHTVEGVWVTLVDIDCKGILSMPEVT